MDQPAHRDRPTAAHPVGTPCLIGLDNYRTTTDTRVAGLGVVGGALFGGYHTLMAGSPPGTGMWPLVASQAVIVSLAATATLTLRTGPRHLRAPAMSIGDGIASTVATLAALTAVRVGELSATGTLIALSPAVTTLLAWTLTGERLHRRQAAGLTLALTAIICLTER